MRRSFLRGQRDWPAMKHLIVLISVACLAVSSAMAQDNNDDEYEDPPYVRPPPFKPCDIAELDKFLPTNIRICAIDAMQGTMPVALLQKAIAMACKMLQKCAIFMKKGTPMIEDDTHRCLHGFMVQSRKTDIVAEAIGLMKQIISEKNYNREKILSAMHGVHDCIDKAGFYLPLHEHQLIKLLSIHFRMLE